MSFSLAERSGATRRNGCCRRFSGVKGNRPQLALLVEIEEIFHHCSKAFLRSKLWKPETWEPDAMPRRAQISKTLERQDTDLAELEQYYGKAYEEKIYNVKY